MTKIVGGNGESPSTPVDGGKVVAKEGSGESLTQIAQVRDLADHSESVSEGSSGKGKRHETLKSQIGVGQTVTTDLPKVAETVVVVQTEVKRQPSQREINILTVTQPQDADHRAAQHQEKERISYSVIFGVSGVGGTGGMIYGLVDERARSSGLGIALAFAAATCLGISVYYLYQVLKSKGIIPHAERNLR